MQLALFLLSLAAVVAGSVFLSQSLGQVRRLFAIPEQFMGFLTALGADSPEITSAIVAMIAGQRDVGVGVIFGSNLFNLAFLLGLSSLVAGGVSVRREPALLDGGVGLVVTAIAVLLALQILPGLLAFCAMLIVLVPYAFALALRRPSIEALALPRALRDFIALAASDKEKIDSKTSHDSDPRGSPSRSILLSGLAAELAVIIAGSTGLVRYTTRLTSGWLPPSLLGPLVLAALTGIPNLYTAVRLGMKNRGAAVVTETMNSNSLNLLVGLAVPSVVVGSTAARTTPAVVEVFWLLAMTAAVVVLLAASGGLKRGHAVAILVSYGIFVAVRVWMA